MPCVSDSAAYLFRLEIRPPQYMQDASKERFYGVSLVQVLIARAQRGLRPQAYLHSPTPHGFVRGPIGPIVGQIASVQISAGLYSASGVGDS